MAGASTVVFVLTLIVSVCALGLSYYVLQKLIRLEQKERWPTGTGKSCKRVRIQEESESEDESVFEEVRKLTTPAPTPVDYDKSLVATPLPSIIVTSSTPVESEDEEE